MMAFNYHIQTSLKNIEKLEENIQDFEIEYKVISSAKCYLLQNHTLIGLYIYGEPVDVISEGSEYLLFYDGREFSIETEGDIIMDYHYH